MALKRKLNLGFGTDPDNVNLSELPLSAKGQIGGVYESKASRWQMYQLVDAGPSVAGDVGYEKVSAGVPLYGQATRTIGNSNLRLVAGIFTRAVTLNYYTLLRKAGVFACKSEVGLTNLGALAVAHTANNALTIVDTLSAATATAALPSVGVALAARDGVTGKTSVLLDIPYSG